MDGDKSKSPSEREADAARRGMFDPAMFLGQNPFALSSSDPTNAYAQLAAAQMSAYSAMMARHPAFAAAPYGGLGMFPEGLGSPLHTPLSPAFMPGGAEWWHAATASEHARQMATSSGYDYFASSLNSLASAFGAGSVTADALNFEALLRDPSAAQKSFGMYGNPFMVPPYSSMVTTTTTSSSHSSPLKQSSSKTTVTSSSSNARSSPTSTASKASSHASSSSKHREREHERGDGHESRKHHSTPPATHTSVIKTVPKNDSSEKEVPTRDSDDEFLAKEVLNHLKNQQAEFLKREQELKLQHTTDSGSQAKSTEAQREMAAEMMRKRQHEQLVSQLKSSQYDAMPNLKKFAEQQLQKHKNKGKEPETSDSKPEPVKKVIETPPAMDKPLAAQEEFLSKEEQDYLNKKRLADQIRQRVQKKAATSGSRIGSKMKGRLKSNNRTMLKIPSTNTMISEEQKRNQEALRAKLEAELKQQQLQLKMAKKAQAQHEKQNEDKSKSREGSKLAQVLLGKTASSHASMQVETSADRPLVATFKTLSTGSKEEEEEEDSSSSSDTSSSDSDDSGSSSSDSDSSSNSDSGDTPSLGKRKAGEGDSSGADMVPAKKQKEVNEEELRIPLEHGWRRETRIRTVGQRGIVGDVVYYAPCSKMLKSLIEINKYLSTNNITDLAKENFNFSTRISVGDFLELSNDGSNGMVSLSEQEVQVLLSAAIQRRPAQRRAVKRTQQKKKEAAKVAAQEKIAKKIEQREIAKLATEQRIRKKMDRDQRKSEKLKVKQLRVEENFELAVAEQERQKQRERFKLLRQREKQQRLEDMRMEREVRAQQLLEAKKRKKQELQSQRFADAMKKAKDREMKRQQAVMLKEQERERRRQHLLLLKALEARKKQEERERMREEKNRERTMIREKKMEQRRMEIQMAYELKKPVDDLRIKDCKPLPKLDRIPGVKLPGEAFANVLMVLEFLNNFGEALDFDSDSIPSLNTLQLGLMNDEDHVEDLMTLLTQLLKLAIDDPGVANPKEAVTKLNQKLADIELNDDNVSEVLRIFMESKNGKRDELSNELQTIPFQALNATNKAASLAFLCNELLSSSVVMGEIEEGIENISNLRKDKWCVEGKLRKLKTLQGKKVNRPIAKLAQTSEDSNSCLANNSKHGSDDEDEESGHESGGEAGEANVSDGEEDASISAEDLEKKIDKLSKQQGQFRHKVFDACRKLRAVDFGMDRYKRRYWVLPHAGGLFVEGVESGDLAEFAALNPEPDRENLNSTKEYEDEEKKDPKREDCKSEAVKKEGDEKPSMDVDIKCNDKLESKPLVNGNNSPVEKVLKGDASKEIDTEDVGINNCVDKIVKHEPVKMEHSDSHSEKGPTLDAVGKAKDDLSESSKLKVEPAAVTEAEKDVKPVVNGIDSSHDNPIKGSDKGDVTPAKPPSTSSETKGVICNAENSRNSSPRTETPNCSRKALSGYATPEMSRYNTSINSADSSKMDTSSGASFMSPYFMSGQFGHNEHMMKHGGNNDAHWFSILPKVACDDHSVTNVSPTAKVKQEMPSSSGYSPFNFSSPMFSPLQMGQLSGSPFGYGMMPMTSSPYFYQTGDSMHAPPSESSMDCMNVIPPENLHSDPQPIPSEMQKGWWRITDPNQFKHVLRCLLSRGYREKHLQRNFQKNMDFAIEQCGKGSQEVFELDITAEDREISQNACSAPSPDKKGSWKQDIALELEQSVLEDVEALEERMFNASLQVKAWKLPTKATEDEDIILITKNQEKTSDKMQYAMEVARSRLMALEQNIERRYLKPPLNKAPEISIGSSHRSSPVDEEMPKGLVAWRQCVTMATSPSQLSLCLAQLTGAIAWEKSVMKVLCQICRLDDNEAELLLCDSCDKGYHTYCFKPPMTNIPEGDWFCYECVSRANKTSHCIRCGKKNGRMAICNHCPVAFHIDCIDPPFQRTPRKWVCGSCSGCKSKYTYQRSRHSKAKDGRKKQTSESNEDDNSSSNVGSDACPTPEKKSRKNEPLKNDAAKSETTNSEVAQDFTACWSVLSMLEKHPDSKPFSVPVNCKKFPSYRKFIKKPMDFTTIRNKLKHTQYKLTSEFADDVRQIFDNCQIFNEDDSDVGEAGHALRKLFEENWSQSND